MAQPIGSLRAELSAGHAAFASDMKKAKDAVQKNATGMSAAMGKVGKKFTEAATALNRFGGYALAGAITASALFVKKQIDVADKMGKLAQATGNTSEYISGMTLVASQAGTSLETIAKGTQRLSMNMNDMRRGVGESKETFELLGIQVAEADGTLRNSEAVIKDIADKFSEMQDGADKTAAAMRIFGRAGAELIPMLNMGSDGIAELQRKAEEMGIVISTKTALQAAYLNDQLDIMKNQALGAGRSIALNLVPWLNEAMTAIKLAKEESGTLMAAWVALGAAGAAVFGQSLEKQIKDARHELEELEAASIRIKEEGAEAGLDIIGFNVSDAAIEQARQKLYELEVEKKRLDEAEKKRMEASLQRHADEAEAKRQQTEAMIKAMDANIAADEAEAQAQQEKNRLLLEEERKREEIYQWIVNTDVALEEMRQASIEGARESIAALNEQEGVLKEIVDVGKDQFEELKQAIEGWGRDSTNAIVQFARTGEMSFSDMIDSMIDDLMRMVIQQQIMGPLFQGIGGFIGGLFGSAHGNVFQNGNLIPYARGGIVTQPTIFPMATGAGLMGEAGPEAIMPLTRIGGDLGVKAAGGGVEVNIINNVGADVSTSERTTADGQKAIDVYIDQAMAKKLGQFGSQSNRALRQMGGQQPLTGR